MKHYFAILGWTVGVWLTMSISFGLSFPGVGRKVLRVTSGPSGYSGFTELLVFYGRVCAGPIAVVLGLLGLLPGTDAKDDEDDHVG